MACVVGSAWPVMWDWRGLCGRFGVACHVGLAWPVIGLAWPVM